MHYLRVNPVIPLPPNKMGPKDPTHPTIGSPCLACWQDLTAGDYTTLVPLGPGDDDEARAKRRASRVYNAVAIEVHWACATGAED